MILDSPQKAALLRVRLSLEKGGLRTTGRITLTGLSEAEREGFAGILGMAKVPSDRVTFRLETLDAALRNSRAQAGLEQLLTELGGPLQDFRAERAASRAANDAFWQAALNRPEVIERPPLQKWVLRLRSGLLKRIAQNQSPQALLDRGLVLVRRLPGPRTRLPILAAEVTGDPHTLDPGKPLSTLALLALAALADRPPPASAAERRSLWDWAGVTLDDLSSEVLVHALRPSGDSYLAKMLRTSSDQGEPFRLTLRQVTRNPLTFSDCRLVSVVENPSIIGAIADRHGGDCQPTICVEGMPSGAAEELLTGIVRQGIAVRFHGDFDWGGLAIGNILFDRYRAVPWQYSASHYLEALRKVPERTELAGSPMQALWDGDLSTQMLANGQAIYEEQLVHILVQDLAKPS